MRDRIIAKMVPIVDVLSAPDLSTCPQVQQLNSAFSKVGFVFIKNHGIDRKQVDKVFHSAKDFFSLPLEVKQKYTQRFGENGTGNSGYVSMEQENVDESKPGDLKECIQTCSMEGDLFPNDELPSFKPTLFDLYKSGIALGLTVLELMGHALQLKDPLFFVKNHKNLGHANNFTTIRALYYPPLLSTADLKPGQLRLGEHVDYGSITLLFQDPIGGLQVKLKDGGYIDVPYMPEAVLVNLGAQMQKWTSDVYLATPHRVLLPEDEEKRRKGRQSLVIFLHPDYDTLIECVDGSNKYPAVTAYEDTMQRFRATYERSFQ